MQPPISLSDFTSLMLAGGAFGGLVSAAVTAYLLAFLARRGVVLGEETRREISLAVPFVLLYLCYFVSVALGQNRLDVEGLWAAGWLAVSAATGKQVAFAAVQRVQQLRAE